jgi:ribosomal protein L12E/L44/L45/RPP1/RPP2
MTATTTTETTATVTEITTGATRATWKQHGNPTAGFEFYGTAVKAPAAKGVKVAKVETDSQGITLKGGNGRPVKGGQFGTATKFWATVPAEAPRKAAPAKAPAAPAKPIEITAPKGGDQTVAPRKGAIGNAISATGSNIMAISRENGLNPSQMRRLAADTVAKVDLARAEAIAAALGKSLGDLFEAPVAKASAKAPAAPAPAETPKVKAPRGRKAKATPAVKADAPEGDPFEIRRQAVREVLEAKYSGTVEVTDEMIDAVLAEEAATPAE